MDDGDLEPMFRHKGFPYGPIKENVAESIFRDSATFYKDIESKDQPRKLRSTPAATAEPITPATLGPIACISR